MSRILILRPRPGADETAARAAAIGLENVVAPLFTIRPLEWAAPNPEDFEALFVTSANALRFGGLDPFLHLPLYAVGEATAEAARRAGFDEVRTGPSDGVALVAMMETHGIERALRLVGRDHIDLGETAVSLEPRFVYAAEAVEALPEEAETALRQDALALLHSPRAGRVFAGLVDAAGLSRTQIAIAALSGNVAEAAGDGWKSVSIAPDPRDEALLELASELCHR